MEAIRDDKSFKETRPQFLVIWQDTGREPQCDPDPAFLKGRDINLARGADNSCLVELQYPAPRIGVYYLECFICRLRVCVTTAGRVDDPRQVRLPCKCIHRSAGHA
jgi:hypothetical protein